MLLKTFLKVPDASTSVLNLPSTVLKCQRFLGSFRKFPRPLNAIENLLKSTRALYKCLKPSQNYFNLPEASRTILKVP